MAGPGLLILLITGRTINRDKKTVEDSEAGFSFSFFTAGFLNFSE